MSDSELQKAKKREQDVRNIIKDKTSYVFRLMEVCGGRFGNSPDTN